MATKCGCNEWILVYTTDPETKINIAKCASFPGELALFVAFPRVLVWRTWNRWQRTPRVNLLIGRTLGRCCVVVDDYLS